MMVQDPLWCIHKVKEFESDSQPKDNRYNFLQCCDVSTKLKNLKATHNAFITAMQVVLAVMYPQS